MVLDVVWALLLLDETGGHPAPPWSGAIEVSTEELLGVEDGFIDESVEFGSSVLDLNWDGEEPKARSGGSVGGGGSGGAFTVRRTVATHLQLLQLQ